MNIGLGSFVAYSTYPLWIGLPTVYRHHIRLGGFNSDLTIIRSHYDGSDLSINFLDSVHIKIRIRISRIGWHSPRIVICRSRRAPCQSIIVDSIKLVAQHVALHNHPWSSSLKLLSSYPPSWLVVQVLYRTRKPRCQVGRRS
ncbi:hypothetical protein PILCRDRAFT_654583 [Piloderma croceum F 1598]|uniref:Uncharacterized protein n=1 Tax=Piloderma croceum (strain F 1598) TaxID=765440 RepID=A0A0C3AQD3_PILCF|nr:hypothetical protein PILCRDRAFT_654583 [Piloderma croceum F 1598]